MQELQSSRKHLQMPEMRICRTVIPVPCMAIKLSSRPAAVRCRVLITRKLSYTQKLSGENMGQVKVEMQVMPADPDVDLGLLKQKIVDCMPSCAKICAEISEVPIAFGLKALKV
ncbi:MAG: hypothetical protein II940_04435, partial [Methanosarcinaceae archaeon]|nr:hypothetical protein [Methanosarcinaceae archaeon]